MGHSQQNDGNEIDYPKPPSVKIAHAQFKRAGMAALQSARLLALQEFLNRRSEAFMEKLKMVDAQPTVEDLFALPRIPRHPLVVPRGDQPALEKGRSSPCTK